MNGRDRLIVALDVPTGDDALRLIDELDGVVFFKIGLQLFVSGQWQRVIDRLTERDKAVFLDLKIPDDIGHTVKSVIEVCKATPLVKFLTLSAHVTAPTIRAAKEGRGASTEPKLLTVPYLSSFDESDLRAIHGRDMGLESFILERAKQAVEAGCDGLIASGDAISQLRDAYPDLTIVSPGIRPAGSSADDHKRFTTPYDAIKKGADYLVVGRPITKSTDPTGSATSIIEEIDRALGGGPPVRGAISGLSGYRPAAY